MSQSVGVAELADADLVSSELILTDIPRAVRRDDDPSLPLVTCWTAPAS